MSNTIFNLDKTNLLTEPMFFGNPLNIQRFDEQKYFVFESLFEKQLSFFWRPEEIDISKDIAQYQHQLTPKQKHIFISNISYQILMDSVNSRAPSIAFLPFVTIPELEQNFIIWSMMELIHSRSYTHIIKAIEPNPDYIFDNILTNANIIERGKFISKYYDDFIEYSTYYRMFGYGTFTINNDKIIKIDAKTLYKKLYMALISVYILEGVRFYQSFVCSFAFPNQKPSLMVGTSNILALISRDEHQHTGIVTNIIRTYKNHEKNSLMTEIMNECQNEVMELFKYSYIQEANWTDYLFDGDEDDSTILLGLNGKLLKQYTRVIINKRLLAIGLPMLFPDDGLKHNLQWTNSYFGTEDEERSTASPQDTEFVDYQLGKLNTNSIIDFNKIKKLNIF